VIRFGFKISALPASRQQAQGICLHSTSKMGMMYCSKHTRCTHTAHPEKQREQIRSFTKILQHKKEVLNIPISCDRLHSEGTGFLLALVHSGAEARAGLNDIGSKNCSYLAPNPSPHTCAGVDKFS